MANFRKSFNFRSGVQVDSDNFVVTPLGLVGIGTTIPSQLLDVRGTATVSGLVTTKDLYVSGISTFNQVTVSTVTAGVVTASYFYGDGAGLTNIPTSQWIDADVGLGYTSIYAAGNVGVATTDPRHTFQVGSDPTVSGKYGVGISSSGNIYSSGIVTAVSFIGDGSQLTGIGLTIDVRTNSLVVSGISTIAVTNATDLTTQQLSVSGVSTFTGNIDANGNLDVDGQTELDQLNVSGVSTFAGNVTASGDLSFTGNLDVDGKTDLDIVDIAETLNVVGVSTFAGNIDANGDLDVDGHTELDQLNVSGVSTFVGDSTFESGNITVGSGNSSAIFRFGNQDSTLDIINNEPGDIRMVLDANPAGINTGNFTWHHHSTGSTLMTLTYQGSLGVNDTSPSEKVSVGGGITATEKSYFGNGIEVEGTVKATAFDGPISLPSIISTSNINSTSGVSTFSEIHLSNNVGLSSIGINTDSPICAIDARGDGSSGVGFFKFIGIATDKLGGVDFPTPNNTDLGQIALDVAGHCRFNSIGIGTTANYQGSTNESFQIFDTNLAVYGASLRLFDNLDVPELQQNIGSIGFNTSFPRSSLDMGLVSAGNTTPALILPNIDTTKRNQMVDPVGGAGTVTGSIIFNSTTSKFEGYNGTTWVELG